uniref:Uncharacterized protein n=1 Tax=Anguilla anguilla TaxID=7936 RepID=A0A0E9RMB1_ANGAN
MMLLTVTVIRRRKACFLVYVIGCRVTMSSLLTDKIL